MIIFAVVGAAVNFLAAYFTSGGAGINQRAVNLHMLEDVLGWLVVLIGAVVMRFTDFAIIDPLMSIGVAVFILVNALKNLKEVFDLFVVKTPKNLSVKEISKALRFPNSNAFIHFFKYHENISPTVFRSQFTYVHINSK